MGLHTRFFPECNLCFLLYLETPFLYGVRQPGGLTASRKHAPRFEAQAKKGPGFVLLQGTSWHILKIFISFVSKVLQKA